MVESYLERELKFDVPAHFALPDLAALSDRVHHTGSASHRLRSEYFDTADHALRQAQVTLRRRTGSTDAGWQLKVPHPPAREELRLPLDAGSGAGSGADASEVPDELAGLLFGIRRGRPLRPVATVEVDRDVTELFDADGRKLAELADDRVRAAASGDAATASSWRELEIELGTGDEALLAELAGLLAEHGARPSASASKLGRALADDRPAPGPLPAYLLEQQRALAAGDLALRRGDEAAIHKTRVATRRFRSTLRTFAALLAGIDGPAGLDAELRWYAGVLGEVRDRQVQRGTLPRLVDELDPSVVLGPVRSRIEQVLFGEQAEHWDVLQEVLRGERYLALLDAIDDFVGRLPAELPAKRLVKLMGKADRKAGRRLATAVAADDAELLHRARKAAKRARYAGELAAPVAGAGAEQASRNEALQDLLGSHQDALVSAELLKRLGLIAGTTPGENGFTFGVLYARQLQRAVELRRQAAEWSSD